MRAEAAMEQLLTLGGAVDRFIARLAQGHRAEFLRYGADCCFGLGWAIIWPTPGAGVGVDATAVQSSIDDWTEVGSEDNVRDDLPVMVRANGIPIQLVRDHGTMVALADRCTHRGGPLHEGTVPDGCVTYPARQPVPARRRRGRPRASHAITAAVRRSGQRWADPGAPGRSGRFAED